MLESNPSADTGGMTKGQGLSALPFFRVPFDSPEALNSGGLRGQEPPLFMSLQPFVGDEAQSILFREQRRQ